MEAKRQARKQREAATTAAELAAKRPVGQPRRTHDPAVTAAADASPQQLASAGEARTSVLAGRESWWWWWTRDTCRAAGG
jgi:hypothetical protein